MSTRMEASPVPRFDVRVGRHHIQACRFQAARQGMDGEAAARFAAALDRGVGIPRRISNQREAGQRKPRHSEAYLDTSRISASLDSGLAAKPSHPA